MPKYSYISNLYALHETYCAIVVEMNLVTSKININILLTQLHKPKHARNPFVYDSYNICVSGKHLSLIKDQPLFFNQITLK